MKSELDLKALRTIHAVITHRSVTLAANDLGISPGTVSYHINRARRICGSHLFFRSGTGMNPDSTALELGERYQAYLRDKPSQKKPETPCQNTLTLNTSSLMQMLLARTLCAGANDTGRYLAFPPADTDCTSRLTRLQNRQVDIDIGPRIPGNNVNAVKLLSTSLVGLTSSASVNDGDCLSLTDWYQSTHLQCDEDSDYYYGDIMRSAEASIHLSRRNVRIMSGTMINMLTCGAQTGDLMLIPEIFLPGLQQYLPLKKVLLPAQIDIRYDCFIHYLATRNEHPELRCVLEDIVGYFRKAECDL